MNRRLLWPVIVVTASLLSACGFQLRGSSAIANVPFQTLHVNAPASSALGSELRRYLQAGGTRMVDEPKAAEAILDVLSEAKTKNILSRNSQGRIREYTLLYNARFQVRSNQAAVLLPPTTLTITRIISFNESQVLAKEEEEAMLYRDMQSDLVQQVLRRVAAIKPAQPGMSLAPAAGDASKASSAANPAAGANPLQAPTVPAAP